MAELAPGATTDRRPGALEKSAARAEPPSPAERRATHHPVRQGRAEGSGQLSRMLEGDQEAPSVMDVATYRLAVGRVVSGLLDQRLRDGLPVGELVFQVRGRLGHSPEVALLSPTDSAKAVQLQQLMEAAVARVTMPPLWQSRGYGIEFRALVGG